MRQGCVTARVLAGKTAGGQPWPSTRTSQLANNTVSANTLGSLAASAIPLAFEHLSDERAWLAQGGRQVGIVTDAVQQILH